MGSYHVVRHEDARSESPSREGFLGLRRGCDAVPIWGKYVYMLHMYVYTFVYIYILFDYIFVFTYVTYVFVDLHVTYVYTHKNHMCMYRLQITYIYMCV